MSLLGQKSGKSKKKIEKNRDNRDFIAFQIEQLDKINPKEGELRQIEQEFDMLTDADQIREDLGAAYNLLDGNDNAILSSLSETSDYLSRVNLALFEERDEGELLKRLENIRVEVKDISGDRQGLS